VRRADRDQICEVKIKTDKLSTKFEDWIEKDLLKLNAFDVRQVELNDYSTQEGVREDGSVGLGVLKRSRMKLDYDDSKSSWKLDEMAEFDNKGKSTPGMLADEEELNNEKLNGLKSALDDLQIVDVERKPQGLSQDLRASDDFVKNREALVSLAQRGFYPGAPAGGQLEIYSSEGEATCTTKDGVRYVLRFGQLAGGEENKGEAEKPGEKEKSNPALNRFLFLTVQFDENQIPKPKLEPMPGEPKPDETPAAESQGDDKDVKPESAAEEPAESKTEARSPGKASNKADPKAKAKVPQKKTSAEETQAEEPAKPDAPADTNDDAKDGETKDAPPATPEDEKRIAVEKENKRKQAEYDDAVKKGQDKVKELNDRFADWYFIISDDVYKKIHLGRGDVVKKKEVKEDKDGAGKADAPDASPDKN
jgi:hypothetical protein